MKKFGQVFQRELKHYVLLRNRIETELEKGLRLLLIPREKTPVDEQVLTLVDFLKEINHVVVECFKSGQISSGLHQLRLAQEVVHKLFVMHLDPKLANRKRISPSEIREKMERHGFPHWRDFYQQLSSISHLNIDFVEQIYPCLSMRSKITKESKMFIEYYLVILNVLNTKALYVVYKRLKPKLGGDYQELVKVYSELEIIVQQDWDHVHGKQEAVFN